MCVCGLCVCVDCHSCRTPTHFDTLCVCKGRAELRAVPWQLLGADGLKHVVDLCSSTLPVAELLQTDALVAAPEWYLRTHPSPAL